MSGSNWREKIAHVALKPLGVQLDPNTTTHITYDDGCRLLLVAEQDRLFSWPVERMAQAEAQGITPTAKISTLNSGPVLDARHSLDGSVLAIQRSSVALEFIAEGGACFWQRVSSGTLLGFFWVNTPEVDLVLVTPQGLELFRLLPQRTGLTPVETKKHTVAWYTYTHETRLVLLGSSNVAPVKLRVYQFANSGIVKLPKFQIDPAPQNKRLSEVPAVMSPSTVVLITMYGRMYCAHVDLSTQYLVLHRFFRDAMLPQHQFPLYSSQVRLSVVDNALLVHQVDSGVVLVLDVLSSTPLHPLASPLPPRLLCADPHRRSATGEPHPHASDPEGGEGGGTHPSPPYSPSCVFLGANMVVDLASGRVWRQMLELKGLEATCQDRVSLLGFLMRRREDLVGVQENSSPRTLAIAVTKAILQDREPLESVSQCFELLCSVYQEALHEAHTSTHSQGGHPRLRPPAPVGGGGGGGHSTSASSSSSSAVTPPRRVLLPRSPALSPEDVLQEILSPLAEEEFGCLDSGPLVLDQHHQQQQKQQQLTQHQTATITTTSSSSSSYVGPSTKDASASFSLAAAAAASSSGGGEAEGSGSGMGRGSGGGSQDSEETRGLSYLFAVGTEYVRCAEECGLVVPGAFTLHLLSLLTRLKRHHLLPAFMPLLRRPPTTHVAAKVAELGWAFPPALQVAQDMLSRPNAHQTYVNLMIQEGRLVDALRYVRRHRVESIAPTVFLDAAWRSGDVQAYHAVFRFCNHFVPAFSNIADYSMYKDRLRSGLSDKQPMVC